MEKTFTGPPARHTGLEQQQDSPASDEVDLLCPGRWWRKGVIPGRGAGAGLGGACLERRALHLALRLAEEKAFEKCPSPQNL